MRERVEEGGVKYFGLKGRKRISMTESQSPTNGKLFKIWPGPRSRDTQRVGGTVLSVQQVEV